MTSTEITKGKKYWVRTSEDAAPRPLMVWRMSDEEPRWFQCIDANGQGYLVHAEAFIRSVEAEPVAS